MFLSSLYHGVWYRAFEIFVNPLAKPKGMKQIDIYIYWSKYADDARNNQINIYVALLIMLFTVTSIMTGHFGASLPHKTIPRENSETGRTFPFLSMPNEACNGLSLAKTHCTFSRGKVSFVDHLLLINLKQWRMVFRWQIVICESAINSVDVSVTIIYSSLRGTESDENAGINNSRVHLRNCYIRFQEKHLPFLDVKATWYHASLLPRAFENRFGHVLYNNWCCICTSRMC